MLAKMSFMAAMAFTGAALLSSCSSELPPEAYPGSAQMLPVKEAVLAPPANNVAYGKIEWTDSIGKVDAMFKDTNPWTGDPYGVYLLGKIVDEVEAGLAPKYLPPPKPEEKRDADKEKELLKDTAKSLLSDFERKNFIIKQINFEAGGSHVLIYWFEVNDPQRPSKLVDNILWSKMCMVRIGFFDPPVAFDKILEKEKARYGEPSVRAFTETSVWDWYHKDVDPKASYAPLSEYSWQKDGLSVLLYDWKDPEEQKGHSEIIVKNDAVFAEFVSKIRARIEELKAGEAKKVESSINKALSN